MNAKFKEQLDKKIESVKKQEQSIRNIYQIAHQQEKVLFKKQFELAKKIIASFIPNKFIILSVESNYDKWMDYTELDFKILPSNIIPILDKRDIFCDVEEKILYSIETNINSYNYILLIDKRLNSENLIENIDFHIFESQYFKRNHQKPDHTKDLFKY